MDKKRIEQAKKIVEFMPDWEKSFQTNKFWHHKLGHDRPLPDLWKDHNLLQDVLDEIKERDLITEYFELNENLFCNQDQDEAYDIVEGFYKFLWDIHNPDTEDIFEAIVKTIDQAEGEVK